MTSCSQRPLFWIVGISTCSMILGCNYRPQQGNRGKDPTSSRNDAILIGGQYLSFSTEKVDWHRAVQRCKDHGAQLASLKNPEALDKYIRDHNLDNQRFWLGGNDQRNEGQWFWLNGQPFQPWLRELGSRVFDQGGWAGDEDCLEWGWGKRFNDENCQTKDRYICEHGNGGCIDAGVERSPYSTWDVGCYRHTCKDNGDIEKQLASNMCCEHDGEIIEDGLILNDGGCTDYVCQSGVFHEEKSPQCCEHGGEIIGDGEILNYGICTDYVCQSGVIHEEKSPQCETSNETDNSYEG